MSFFRKFLITTAASVMLLSVTAAYAATSTNTIIAPGVHIPGYQDAAVSENSSTESSVSAGSGQSAAGPGSSAAAASGSVTIQDTPGAPAVIRPDSSSSSGTGPGGTDTASSSGTSDIETLKAQSLADPYTILETSDPNIVVSRGRTIDKTKPMIALTYDDGPRTDTGARIMDIHEKYGQRTTFFMVGNRVASRAEEVKRMAADGHEVANHSWSHLILSKQGAATIRSEVSKCNDAIEAACGIRPRVMRLPGGGKNSTVLANVDMPIILWNIDTRDWEHRNVDKTCAAVLGKVKDGDIVLMHEIHEPTATATERMVPQLVEQGFQLVTVSELAALKGKTPAAGTVYYSF